MDKGNDRLSIGGGGGRASLESVDNHDYSSLDNIAEDYEKAASTIQVTITIIICLYLCYIDIHSMCYYFFLFNSCRSWNRIRQIAPRSQIQTFPLELMMIVRLL